MKIILSISQMRTLRPRDAIMTFSCHKDSVVAPSSPRLESESLGLCVRLCPVLEICYLVRGAIATAHSTMSIPHGKGLSAFIEEHFKSPHVSPQMSKVTGV